MHDENDIGAGGDRAGWSADRWFEDGREREVAGDLDAALASYREAVGREPDRAEWCYRLGCVLRKRNDLQAAVVAFSRAVEISEGESRYLTNLGATLDALGRRRAPVTGR